METKDNILNELSELGSTLANPGKGNMYFLPEGYFNTFATDMLLEAQFASRPVATTPFHIPAGYFESLPASVLQKINTPGGSEAKAEVFTELELVAPLLNSIIIKNPYTLQAGYFNNLASDIIQKIKETEALEYDGSVMREFAPLLNSISRKTPFTVDALYFEGLATGIVQKITTGEALSAQDNESDELQQVAPLLVGAVRKTPFAVDPSYFKNFAATVTERIFEEEFFDLQYKVADGEGRTSGTAAPWPATPFVVNDGYFDGLASTILQRINNGEGESQLPENDVFEELEQIAPLLNTISKTTPYLVPEGYFEQLAIYAPADIPVAKVIPLYGKRVATAIKWLSAACIVGFIGLAGYFFEHGESPLTIIRPVHPLNIQNSLSEVSDEEISNYLNNMPSPGIETLPNSVLDEQTPDVEPDLQRMSTDEIKDYLDKNSDPGEKSLKDI